RGEQGADATGEHHARGDDGSAQPRLGRARLARGDAPAGGARRRADQGHGGSNPRGAGDRQDTTALRRADDRGAPRRKTGSPRFNTALLGDSDGEDFAFDPGRSVSTSVSERALRQRSREAPGSPQNASG